MYMYASEIRTVNGLLLSQRFYPIRYFKNNYMIYCTYYLFVCHKLLPVNVAVPQHHVSHRIPFNMLDLSTGITGFNVYSSAK